MEATKRISRRRGNYSFRLLIAIIAVWIICFSANTILASSSIVYDNTSAPAGYFDTNMIEYGDEITLGGSDRTITDFMFYYSKENDAEDPTARIRFYKADGYSGSPGSLLYDSGAFALPAGVGDFTHTLSGLSVPVPDTFIWTVEWGSKPFVCDRWCSYMPFDAHLIAYGPPTVGSSRNEYWYFHSYTSSWYKYVGDPAYPFNFGAQVVATTIAAPEPISSILFVTGGMLLAGRRLLRRKAQSGKRGLLSPAPHNT